MSLSCLQKIQSDSPPYRVAFSPNNQVVAVCNACHIQFWCVVSGNLLSTFDIDTHVLHVAFSPSSECVAVGMKNGTIKIWSVNASVCLLTLDKHTDQVNNVAFSPNGCTLASISNDRTARIWDVATGACIHVLHGYPTYVYSIVYSPDSKHVAISSVDNTVQIWNVATGECIYILQEHTCNVYLIVYSNDGKYVATGSEDNTVRIWDTNNGACLHTFTIEPYCTSIAFLHKDQVIAMISDRDVLLRDTKTGNVLHTLKGHTARIHNMTVAPGGRLFATWSHNGTATLWDQYTGKCLITINEINSVNSCVSMSSNGRVLAIISMYEDVRLLDLSELLSQASVLSYAHS